MTGKWCGGKKKRLPAALPASLDKGKKQSNKRRMSHWRSRCTEVHIGASWRSDPAGNRPRCSSGNARRQTPFKIPPPRAPGRALALRHFLLCLRAMTQAVPECTLGYGADALTSCGGLGHSHQERPTRQALDPKSTRIGKKSFT